MPITTLFKASISSIIVGKVAVVCRAQERRTRVRTKSGILKEGR
jgi:hypothetical protein